MAVGAGQGHGLAHGRLLFSNQRMAVSGLRRPDEFFLTGTGHLEPAIGIRLTLFLFPAADRATYLTVNAVRHGAGAVEVGVPGRAVTLKPDTGPLAGGLAHYHQRNGAVAVQCAAAGGARPGAQLHPAHLLVQPGSQVVQEVFLQVDLDIRLAHANSSQWRCNMTMRMATSSPLRPLSRSACWRSGRLRKPWGVMPIRLSSAVGSRSRA